MFKKCYHRWIQMPKLSNHISNELVKCLLIGDPKSGKTGSLISLVKAGYKLRILDMDNLLDILKGLILKECPELIDNVEFVSIRDKRKSTSEGSVIDGKPDAFVRAVKLLDKWREDDVDLGSPSEWGPDCILVIDSLSRLCDAAYDWRETLTPKGGQSGKYDGRAVYGDAQDAIRNVLEGLTSSNYKTSVIVIAHIQYMTMDDGSQRGFPQGIGQKLSPQIPQYFPTVLRMKNKSGKRIIQTAGDPLIDLANPKPFEVGETYPIETGLADIFSILRGKGEPAPETKVTKLQPIRR
jgi:hypothetical protein